MLRLCSRMIGRHKIQLLQFYPNLLRYLTSHNKDKIGEIFAMIIESCHDLIPPETVKPVFEKIISNFITDYCNNQHITVGLNAIREILMRMPMALDEAQIEYLCDFRSNKNKSVSAAAKSLVNYFRDVCPQLLPKKLVGRFTTIDETNDLDNFQFGAQKINFDVDGIELLKKAEKIKKDVNLTSDKILDDKDLKKIRILQLKEGVKRVDRHGFRDQEEIDKEKIAKESMLTSHRDEYYAKLIELMRRKKEIAMMKQEAEEGRDIVSDSEEGEEDSQGYLSDEEGEDEMNSDLEMASEEGEEEMIQGGDDQSEDEFVSDDGESIPKLVKIDDPNLVTINN